MKRQSRILLAATMLAGIATLPNAAFAQSADASVGKASQPKRKFVPFVADGLRNGSV